MSGALFIIFIITAWRYASMVFSVALYLSDYLSIQTIIS